MRIPHCLKKLLRYCRLVTKAPMDSKDASPWEHPYLTSTNLSRFRKYSEQVWQIALDADQAGDYPLKIAFCVNMAQNMTKWGRLARQRGAEAVVFPHPMDVSALNAPEWEVCDGEASDVADGAGFLAEYPSLNVGVPCRRVPWEQSSFEQVKQQYLRGDRTAFLRAQSQSSTMRHEFLLANPEYSCYYLWMCELQDFDVSYACSIPLASYFSGRPYCTFTVGGDLQIDCGRADVYGQVMRLAFQTSQFLMISNPHPLGHCRRLGFSNGLYLPYIMDDQRYCPGDGQARESWEAQLGAGFFILSVARIDQDVKGNGLNRLDALIRAAKASPKLRFVFLGWGNDVEHMRTAINAQELGTRFLFLKPVGKERLIDYYRSCDAVLDQFVYGYYGATALEAASVAKPVLMKMRSEHYAPLYQGDIAPVINCDSNQDLYHALVALADQPVEARRQGDLLRQWLIRNHGQACFMPILLALLKLTARQTPLPKDLAQPLLEPLSAEEIAYHRSRLVPTTA